MASRVPALSPRRHPSVLRRKAPHRAPVPGLSPTWPTEDDWGSARWGGGHSGSRSEHERAAGANAVRPRARRGSRPIGWGMAEGPAAPSVRSDLEAVTPKPQGRVAHCSARDGSPLNRGQCIAHRPWLRPPGLFRQASTRASNTCATSAGSAGTRNARPSFRPAMQRGHAVRRDRSGQVGGAVLGQGACLPSCICARCVPSRRHRRSARRWPAGRASLSPVIRMWRERSASRSTFDRGRLYPLLSARRSDRGRRAVHGPRRFSRPQPFGRGAPRATTGPAAKRTSEASSKIGASKHRSPRAARSVQHPRQSRALLDAIPPRSS